MSILELMQLRYIKICITNDMNSHILEGCSEAEQSTEFNKYNVDTVAFSRKHISKGEHQGFLVPAGW